MKLAVAVVTILMVTAYSEAALTKYAKHLTNNMKITAHGKYTNLISSGLPDHGWQRVNPNSPANKNFNYRVMTYPKKTGKQQCVPHGPIALAKNGVALFNALTAVRDGNKDAVKSERFDRCDGHTTGDGTYHYHQLPGCVYKGTADEFIGVALDGYPIFGPNVTDMKRLIKSKDLDECHGRYVNKRYQYHITTDFPYIIGCYKGTVLRQPHVHLGHKTCKNVKGKQQLCDCTAGSVQECKVAPVGSKCMDKTGKIRRK